MIDILSLDNIFTLAMLVLLQAVLGFDNLLYISIESKRVAEGRQKFVRQSGIIGAVALRIVLLFVIINAIGYFQNPLFGFAVEPMAKSTFYFVILVMVVVDFVQGHYQKKLLAQKKYEINSAEYKTG